MKYFGTILFTVTICLLFLANYTVIYQVFYVWLDEQYSLFGLCTEGIILILAFELLFLLTIISYLRASFSDPGYVDQLLPVPDERTFPFQMFIKYCQRCKTKQFKPPRAHHCKTCKQCIFRMDHHCEWLNNCVGIRNQKYFVLFLVYALFYNIFVLISLIMNAVMFVVSYKEHLHRLYHFNWNKALLTFFIMLSIFFIIMIWSFLKDQIDAIIENQTTVESYKNQQGQPGDFWDNLAKLFGENYWLWALPIQPECNSNYLELLYTEKDIYEINKNRDKIDYFECRFNQPEYHIYRVLADGDKQHAVFNKYLKKIKNF